MNMKFKKPIQETKSKTIQDKQGQAKAPVALNWRHRTLTGVAAVTGPDSLVTGRLKGAREFNLAKGSNHGFSLLGARMPSRSRGQWKCDILVTS